MVKKKKISAVRVRKAVKRLKRAAPKKRLVRKAPKRRRSANAAYLTNAHIRELLTEIAGEKALRVVGEITEPMTDEVLAAAAKVKISEARAVLNKLHSAGLASYKRTRDKDSGWYSYTWQVTLAEAEKLLAERRQNEARALAELARTESAADLYACPGCYARSGIRIPFDEAFEREFRCPECNSILVLVQEKKG